MTDPVASLARSPSGSGEPVAWQKRDKDNPWHSIEDCSDENLYALESMLIRLTHTAAKTY